ncbi:MAG: Tll0287-like domain-containing protein [Nitrospiraceae bacterium]
MISSKKLMWGALSLALVLVGIGLSRSGAATTPSPLVGFSLPIETVADYVHAVIEADRDVYTRHVVERMQSKGIVVASENWAEKNTLPLPAQFLLESGRLIAKKGTGIRYRLISLWPINKQNAASTEFEETGLGTFITQPNRPYVGFAEVGGSRYFQAIYADLAVTQACIGCHNAHPNSPKRDFRLNDVMGGIVISIPLGPLLN